jgi:hypothetical protein
MESNYINSKSSIVLFLKLNKYNNNNKLLFFNSVYNFNIRHFNNSKVIFNNNNNSNINNNNNFSNINSNTEDQDHLDHTNND